MKEKKATQRKNRRDPVTLDNGDAIMCSADDTAFKIAAKMRCIPGF